MVTFGVCLQSQPQTCWQHQPAHLPGVTPACTACPLPHPLWQEDNVWTGHLKGTVRVRPKHKWEWKTEEQAFSTTIRVSCGTDGPDQEAPA